MRSLQRSDSTNSLTDATIINPPISFSYHSPALESFNELKDEQVIDSTSKILEFLAVKVDTLAVSINTIQYNLSKISESVQRTMEENNDSKVI